MADILPIIQIILSLLLVVSVLLQHSDAGLGSGFGGGDGSIQYTRRGLEKKLFYGTMIIAVLFAISAFATLFVGR